MAGQDDSVEDLKIILGTQERTCYKRLSRIKASRENADGLQEAPTRGDQPPSGFEGVGTSGQAGFATSSTVGVTTNSLLQTVGDEVEIGGGSSLAVGSREISSIKTAVPKFGSSVEFSLWKRRFEGFAFANDCMQAFTTAIDMSVGDPSVFLVF